MCCKILFHSFIQKDLYEFKILCYRRQPKSTFSAGVSTIYIILVKSILYQGASSMCWGKALCQFLKLLIRPPTRDQIICISNYMLQMSAIQQNSISLYSVLSDSTYLKITNMFTWIIWPQFSDFPSHSAITRIIIII